MRKTILFTCLVLTGCFSSPGTKNIIAGKVPFNEKIQWRFSPCGELLCNGMALRLSQTVAEWDKILGKHDRYNELMNDVYTWDKYGLMAVTEPQGDTIHQLHIVFNFKPIQDTLDLIERQGPDTAVISSIRAAIYARPRPFFEGGILLDSVVLGKATTVKEFNELSEKNHRQFRFHQDASFKNVYAFFSRNCGAPRRFEVHLSEDQQWIDELVVDDYENIISQVDQGGSQ